MDQNAPAIHSVHQETDGFSTPVMVFIFILAIVVGTGVGYVIAGPSKGPVEGGAGKMMGLSAAKKTAGVKDEKKFPDKTEGTLKEGGIEGEGNFHLERPGGESQNVYLTSSIVDLSEYVGRKIRVHGQTFQGEKAGWLMDVGYVESL